jgi:hypothetical protein
LGTSVFLRDYYLKMAPQYFTYQERTGFPPLASPENPMENLEITYSAETNVRYFIS